MTEITTPTDEVAAVLRGAAELLRKDGWCQRYALDEGRRCVGGAIARVGGPLDLYWEARDALMKALGISYGIAQWNDQPGRTADEVIAALTAAAEGRAV